ncbi:hypothetical protein [Oceanobacillus jeddahense]|uniref:Uncharacterized protein n=1 Tax=Oceanobacillus jeddahense TaxID=1462527 RepID=A0ABY5JS18_9BACI|nr:hypothetical protein [Oceanobacillus jeddahense]UUI01672.1 hypothetical protein NP439_16660 [Oceanobacillus jeddahense]
MKKFGIILLFIAFTPILNSCQAEEDMQVIEFQFTDYQVIYVPPEEDNDSYMNTFIDLKAKYPEEITSPEKRIMDNQDMPSDYTLNNNSIYLLKDEAVIYSIENTMSRGDLMKTLDSIVSTDNQIIY